MSNPLYLTTDAVRARYGTVTIGPDGKPKFQRSRMWIDRRRKLAGFPEPIHFGASPTNYWVLAEVEAWDAANRHRNPNKPVRDAREAQS